MLPPLNLVLDSATIYFKNTQVIESTSGWFVSYPCMILLLFSPGFETLCHARLVTLEADWACMVA